MLLAALSVLDLEALEERQAPTAAARVVVPSASADDDLDAIDLAQPVPRSLADYREERGMTIPQFTALLGILHHDYAAVIHRQPVDRRLRDQIAFRLGVPWPAIAEFMPLVPPEPRPRPIPIPAPPEATPPDEAWYLVDDHTGTLISGPHHEAPPLNVVYLADPILYGPTNLVILWDDDWFGEEHQLSPVDYMLRERQRLYDEPGADGDNADADGRAAWDE